MSCFSISALLFLWQLAGRILIDGLWCHSRKSLCIINKVKLYYWKIVIANLQVRMKQVIDWNICSQVYFLDTQVWYTIIAALVGGLVGARMHLGEVSFNLNSHQCAPCYRCLCMQITLQIWISKKLTRFFTFLLSIKHLPICLSLKFLLLFKKLFLFMADPISWHVEVAVFFFAGRIRQEPSSLQRWLPLSNVNIFVTTFHFHKYGMIFNCKHRADQIEVTEPFIFHADCFMPTSLLLVSTSLTCGYIQLETIWILYE